MATVVRIDIDAAVGGRSAPGRTSSRFGAASRARRAREAVAHRSGGAADAQPLDVARRDRLVARKIHATRARDLHEESFFGLEADLGARRGGRLADVEEPLPLVPVDAVIEVAVRV